MTEAEKILRKVGGKRVDGGRHIVYMINGERFTIHKGSKANHLEVVKLKSRLRQLGLLEK